MDLHTMYDGVLLTCYEEDNINDTIPSIWKIGFIIGGDIHTIWYDERDNTIERFGKLEYTTDIEEGEAKDFFLKLKSDFNKYKLQNPSLGNIDTGAEIEYSPERHLMIKDFFEFLKSENRETKINKILN